MIKNKKFINLNDALNYSKQNGLKILAIILNILTLIRN
jgi:hypothetical protein